MSFSIFRFLQKFEFNSKYYFFLQQLKHERNLQINIKTIITKHNLIATIKFDDQLSVSPNPNHSLIFNVLQRRCIFNDYNKAWDIYLLCNLNEICIFSIFSYLRIFSQNETSSIGWGIFITLTLGMLGGFCTSWNIWRCWIWIFFLHVDILFIEIVVWLFKQIVTIVWLSYRFERRMVGGAWLESLLVPLFFWHGTSRRKENDSLKK